MHQVAHNSWHFSKINVKHLCQSTNTIPFICFYIQIDFFLVSYANNYKNVKLVKVNRSRKHSSQLQSNNCAKTIDRFLPIYEHLFLDRFVYFSNFLHLKNELHEHRKHSVYTSFISFHLFALTTTHAHWMLVRIFFRIYRFVWVWLYFRCEIT